MCFLLKKIFFLTNKLHFAIIFCMMRKAFFYIALFLVSVAYAQDNWFMAQTEKAVVVSVSATSELVEAQFDGKYLYPPINILDGNFDTTWCEADRNGSGIGEEITIGFEEAVSFDEIEIVNGFASKDYYKKNNRVKKIRLTQTAGKHFQQKDYLLQDNTPTWQSISFPLTQTAQTITIKLLDVYKGDKYDDTCLDCFRLKYKGKVIPFENVSELKKVQEENSRLMLSGSEEQFKKQFFSFFDGIYSTIFLVKDNPSDPEKIECVAIKRWRNDIHYISKFKISSLMPKNVKALKEAYHTVYYSDDIWNKTEKHNDSKCSKYKPSLYKYYSLSNKNSGLYNSIDYELGNGRIVSTSNIDYVKVKTVKLLKIEGKSIFINNVKYNIVDEKDIFFFDFAHYDD